MSSSLSLQLPFTVALFPIHPIKRTSLEACISKLRECSRLSLADVPLHGQSLTQEDATVFLDFWGPSTAAESSEEGHPLRDVPLASIGIVDCTEWGDDLSDAHSEYERVTQNHVKPVPFLSRCYAFNPKEAHKDLQDLILVPSIGDQKFYLAALLADLVASVVTQLTTLADSMDRPASNPSPGPFQFRSDSSRQLATSSSSKNEQNLDASTASKTPSPPPQTPPPVPKHTTEDWIRNNVMSPSHSGSHPRPGTKLLSARVAKLRADIALVSGRWSDAGVGYRESSTLAKASQDYIWNAGSQEGTVTVQLLQAWRLAHASNRPPNSRPSFVDLHNIHSSYIQVLNLYSTSSFPSNSAEPSPPFVFACACLRTSRVMYACWLFNGWDEKSLDFVINYDDPSGYLMEPPTIQRPSLHKSTSGVSRSEAAHYAALPLSPNLLDRLSPRRRLLLLSNAAVLLGYLGSHRKRAVVLREIAAAVADRGVYVKDMIYETLAIYGITDISKSQGTRESVSRSSRWSFSPESIAGDSHSAQFGWRELQAATLHDALTICEMIPDYQMALQLAVRALPLMSPMEQRVVKDSMDRVYNAVRRRKINVSLPYWGPPNILISLETSENDSQKTPISNPHVNASTNNSEISQRNPFIYNPNQIRTSTFSKPILVQNEVVTVMVTLQNTYHFPIVLRSIELSVSGVPVLTNHVTATLLPTSFHTLSLEATPLEAGSLTIRGCNIGLGDCEVTEFCVPVWNEQDEEKRKKHQSLQVDREKLKGSLLFPPQIDDVTVLSDNNNSDHFERGNSVDNNLSFSSNKHEGEDPPALMRYLEFKVIDALPLIHIADTSLTHDSLMLYDGEKSSIKISLQNHSPLDVTFLHPSFTDTRTKKLQKMLNDGDIDPLNAYDIEKDLIEQPVFSCPDADNFILNAGDTRSIDVICVGRLGCTSAVFRFVYGTGNKDQTMYCREIVLQLSITVRPSLIPQTWQIFELETFPRDFTNDLKEMRSASRHSRTKSVIKRATMDTTLEDDLTKADGLRHCLLKVEISNVCSVAFDVEISRNDGGINKSHKLRIEPGSTSSMLARIERILLPPEQSSQPVPSLTDRQYVVPKVKGTIEEEKRKLEMFWYRIELCSRIQLTWREAGTLRKGSVSIDSLQLSPTSFERLRVDPIKVDMDLETENETDNADDITKFAGQMSKKAFIGQYVTIRVKLENRSAGHIQNVKVSLGLEPKELEHHIVIQGLDQVDVDLQLAHAGDFHETEFIPGPCPTNLAFRVSGPLSPCGLVSVYVSGVEKTNPAVSSELVETFNSIAPSGTTQDGQRIRAIVAEIANESLVEKKKMAVSTTPEADLSLLTKDYLDDTTPVFVFYLHDDAITSQRTPASVAASYASGSFPNKHNPAWTFVSYVPHEAPVRAKFLYGSSKNTIAKQLGENRFSHSVFITSRDDAKEILPKTSGSSEAAMSETERLNEQVKRAEREDYLNATTSRTPWRQNSNDSGSSSNISNPQSHISTGTSTKWDDGVEDALKALVGDEPTRKVVHLTIDLPKEVVVLADENSLELPAKDPRFVFASIDNKIVFVYSCPSSSPIRSRMIFASTAGSVSRGAITAGVPIAKKIETSDPTEITEDFLRTELRPSRSNTDSSVENIRARWESRSSSTTSSKSTSRTATPFLGAGMTGSAIGTDADPSATPPPLEARFSKPKRPGR